MANVVEQEVSFFLAIQPKREDVCAVTPRDHRQGGDVLDQNRRADALVAALDGELNDFPAG